MLYCPLWVGLGVCGLGFSGAARPKPTTFSSQRGLSHGHLFDLPQVPQGGKGPGEPRRKEGRLSGLQNDSFGSPTERCSPCGRCRRPRSFSAGIAGPISRAAANCRACRRRIGIPSGGMSRQMLAAMIAVPVLAVICAVAVVSPLAKSRQAAHCREAQLAAQKIFDDAQHAIYIANSRRQHRRSKLISPTRTPRRRARRRGFLVRSN